MEKFKHYGLYLLCAVLTVGLYAVSGGAKAAMLPVDNHVIVLDAGHGGWDPGKTGVSGKNEKEINLAIVGYLAEYLETAGAEVVLTREGDNALSNKKKEDMRLRRDIAEGAKADIVVSIHQNSYPAPSVHGAQTFYVKEDLSGKKLAETIMERLRSEVEPENHRQAKDNGDYYILVKTETPAAIVECGFLTNPEEEAKLNSAEYQQKIAWAVYLGIMDYLAGANS